MRGFSHSMIHHPGTIHYVGPFIKVHHTVQLKIDLGTDKMADSPVRHRQHVHGDGWGCLIENTV